MGGISLKSLLLRKITYSPDYVNENTCSQNWRNYIGYLFLCVYPFLDMEYFSCSIEPSTKFWDKTNYSKILNLFYKKHSPDILRILQISRLIVLIICKLELTGNEFFCINLQRTTAKAGQWNKNQTIKFGCSVTKIIKPARHRASCQCL